MSTYYYQVDVKRDAGALQVQPELLDLAQREFRCDGVEEFQIDEAMVDEILGEKSFCGGDLSEELIEVIEEALRHRPATDSFFFYGEVAFDRAEKFLAFLQEKNYQAFLEMKLEKNWNEEWQSHFEPIQVGKTFTVLPDWQKEVLVPFGKKLIIKPAMAFGTGHHETSSLCLELLSENEKSIKEVNDFGCGSGILGIASFLLGATSVDFYDIDQKALDNTRENLVLNELDKSENYRLIHSKDRQVFEKKQYDLVFANILLDVLKIEAKNLSSHLKEEGALIVSGILKEQWETCREIFESQGLELESYKEKSYWVAASFRKKLIH